MLNLDHNPKTQFNLMLCTKYIFILNFLLNFVSINFNLLLGTPTNSETMYPCCNRTTQRTKEPLPLPILEFFDFFEIT